jgi:hypothetical protein
VLPTFLTVGESILQVEGGVGEELATIGAGEALRMERLAHGFQTVLNKKKIIFKTRRGKRIYVYCT